MFFLKGKFFPLMVLALSIAVMPAFVQAKTIDLGTVSDTVRIPGQLLNTSLSGDGNRCLYVDSSGNLSVKGFDCGSSTGGDDMGSHSATQNIRLNSFWLSGDGGNEGVFVNAAGSVGVGLSNPTVKLDVAGGINLTDRQFTLSGNVRTFENVAQYHPGSTPTTGTVVVTIANTPNIMLDAEITIQGYGGLTKCHVRGYTYTSTSGWHLPAATCLGSGPIGAHDVRFGKRISDNARVIMIGNTSTNWGNYPHVVVKRVSYGYPGSGVSAGDWSISIVTDETPYNSIVAVEENNGFKSYNSNFGGTTYLTNGIWNSSGNVGIGMTAPSSKLYVSGDGYFTNSVTVGSPTAAGHAATKGYVDSSLVSWSRLTSFPSACPAGQYVTTVGAALTCATPPDTNTDIYWTGTATNLNAATGRASLGLGSLATQSSVTDAQVPNNITIDYASSAGTATSLAANGANCSAGYYPLGVDASGAAESCTLVPSSSDIYWTGTATNLNAATGRASLGLGSLATLSAVTSAYISNGTIVDADVSASAAIAASKIQYGSYFITSAGTNGQVWTSDGSGAGRWTTISTGGLSGSGTANYISKWTGATSQGNSVIYDNGTNLGIGNTAPGARMQINAGTGEALRLVTNASYSPLNIRNSANSADIWRIDQNGSLAVGTVPVARVSGLGSLATLNSVTSSQITNYTITNLDVASAAAIDATKINFGEGTDGYVWTSDGRGGEYWAAAAGGGSLPSGTAHYTLKYGLGGWEQSSNLVNNGSIVGINFPSAYICDSSTKLIVNGRTQVESLYISKPIASACSPGANLTYNQTYSRLEVDSPIYATGFIRAYGTGTYIQGAYKSYDGSTGVSATYYLDDCAGNQCTMTVKNGIITASTCPTNSTSCGDPIIKD
jgi:hypothetical protein